MSTNQDLEWIVEHVGGSRARFIAGQLRERAATVRDDELRARDRIAELDIARMNPDLSRDEYEEIDDEIAEAQNVIRVNKRLGDSLMITASDLLRLDREREQ